MPELIIPQILMQFFLTFYLLFLTIFLSKEKFFFIFLVDFVIYFEAEFYIDEKLEF